MSGFQALDRISMLSALPGAASGHYDFPISQPIELEQTNALFLALQASPTGTMQSYDIIGRVQINGEWVDLPSVTGTIAAGATALVYTSINLPGFLVARREIQRCIATVFDPSTGAPPAQAPTVVALLEDLQTVIQTSSGGGGGGGGQTTPNVTSVSPNTWGHLTNVPGMTITGVGFTGATSVKIGATSLPFSQKVDDKISTLPLGSAIAAGTYDVTVTTPSGTSALVAADKVTVT